MHSEHSLLDEEGGHLQVSGEALGRANLVPALQDVAVEGQVLQDALRKLLLLLRMLLLQERRLARVLVLHRVTPQRLPHATSATSCNTKRRRLNYFFCRLN